MRLLFRTGGHLVELLLLFVGACGFFGFRLERGDHLIQRRFRSQFEQLLYLFDQGGFLLDLTGNLVFFLIRGFPAQREIVATEQPSERTFKFAHAFLSVGPARLVRSVGRY